MPDDPQAPDAERPRTRTTNTVQLHLNTNDAMRPRPVVTTEETRTRRGPATPRKTGRQGGLMRAARTPATERSADARAAANTRWSTEGRLRAAQRYIDALTAERDRLREALALIADAVTVDEGLAAFARAALAREPDAT